ncbi:MAG: hypothetical protein JO020_17105 [Chloroflexi bacterium]|nr:hypothetical protein [Chloroflexota bacterium]
MSALKSTRLAWCVAIASLALWAFSAPISWGQVTAGAHRLFDDENTTTGADSTTVISINQSSTVTSSSSGDTSTDATACPPVPPAIVQVLPTITIPPAPAVTTTGSDSGSFHICGPDPQAEQAISQLIAGRGFSATLSARNDGCADLTIKATSQGTTSGSASTNLNVSLGSGQSLSIKIVSQGGASHTSITFS